MLSVEYDPLLRRHVVVVRLDPDEAENVADALGSDDRAHRELYKAAEQARAADEER